MHRDLAAEVATYAEAPPVPEEFPTPATTKMGRRDILYWDVVHPHYILPGSTSGKSSSRHQSAASLHLRLLLSKAIKGR